MRATDVANRKSKLREYVSEFAVFRDKHGARFGPLIAAADQLTAEVQATKPQLGEEFRNYVHSQGATGGKDVGGDF